jgi:hypothetical protein
MRLEGNHGSFWRHGHSDCDCCALLSMLCRNRRTRTRRPSTGAYEPTRRRCVGGHDIPSHSITF